MRFFESVCVTPPPNTFVPVGPAAPVSPLAAVSPFSPWPWAPVAPVSRLSPGSDNKPASADKPPATISGNERSILATVDALQTASRKGDGQKVCADLFMPRLMKSVEAAAKRSCAQEARRSTFTPDAEISVGRQIEVVADRGTAVIREQNGTVPKLSFLKQSGQWRIDRVTP